MKRKLVLTLFGAMLILALWNCQNQGNKPAMGAAVAPLTYETAAARFRSYCYLFPPPAGVTDTFTLSQSYPDSFDVNAAKPWLAIDFKKDYEGYMKAVLDYCLEGNLEVDFKVQNNNVRKWYSTPWMDDDGKRPNDSDPKKRQNPGREYWHGLTREIDLNPGTLGVGQKTSFQTYAIAFYNEPGGYTIGKVWKDANNPDITQSDFPDGTVVFKLLFTEADTTEVPSLANSKKWTANIFTPSKAYDKRTDTDVRLLQLDVAVKDKRADTFVEGEGQGIGWVFGTFVYDYTKSGKNWVDKLVPLGIMWGDDPDVLSNLNKNSQFNPDLKQSIINKSYVGADGTVNKHYTTHLGMAGRMNGPVDNPISSCVSCHAHAALTLEGEPATMANFSKGGKDGKPSTYDATDMKKYFGLFPCGVKPFEQTNNGVTKTYIPADYSYQIANGIRNFKNHQIMTPKAGERKLLKSAKPLPFISRDGD
jgi:hypothetical protein